MADGRVEIVDTVGLDVVPQADNWGTKLRAAVLPDAERVGREVAARIAAPIGKKIADAIRDGVQEGGKLAVAAATKAGEKAGAEFARAARAKIEAALSKAFDATVNLDLDLSAAEARLKAFGAGTTVTVNVDLDDTAARAKLAALASTARSMHDVNVKVDVRIPAASLAALKAVDTLLSKIDGRSVNAHLDLRGHGALLSSLATVQAALDRIDGRNVKVKASVTGLPTVARLAALQAALDKLDGRSIDIHINIHPPISGLLAQLLALHGALNGLGSAANRNGNAFSNLFGNLFGSFSGRFGLITGIFSTIGNSIAAAISSTFEFVVAIGKLVVAWLTSAGAASIEAAATAAATAALGAMAAVVVGAAAGLLALAGAAVIAGAALTVIAGILSLVGVAAGLVPAAFGAIAFGATALVAAFLPVVSVLQDYLTGQDKVGQAAQAVKKAQVDAADRIRNATEAVSQAQRQEQYAQESLTRARKEAARQLEDLALQVRGLGNDEEAARIRLARAQENLVKVNRDTTATALDRREAVLGVKQAELGLEETLKNGQRTRADYLDAQKKGVAGADQVVQAQRQVDDAHRATAKAVRDASKAQVDAAATVSNAQQAYAKAAQSLGFLTDTGRLFVEWLKPLVDFFRNDVSKVAQDLMFPGFIAFLEAVKPYMKDHTFADTIGLVAAAIGDVGRQFSELYKGTAGRQFVNDLRDIAAAGADFVRSLGAGAVSLIRDMVTGFADLARASKPLTDAMGQFFALVGDGLKRFFQALGDKATMKALSDIFWVLGKTIKDTLVVLGPVIAQLAQDFAPVFAQLEPVLVDFLRAVGKILTQMSQRGVMEAFVKVFDSLVQVMVRMTQGSPSMIEKLADSFVKIMDVLTVMVNTGLLDRLLNAFVDLTPQLVQIATYAAHIADKAGPLISLFEGLAKISLFALSAEVFLVSKYIDGLKVGLDGISHWFGTTLPNLLNNDVKKNGPGWTGFWKELKNEWNNWFSEPIGTWFGTTLPGYMTDTKKNGAGWTGFTKSLTNEWNNWFVNPVGHFFTVTIPEWFDKLNNLGPDFIRGLIKGIGDTTQELYTKVAGWLWEGPDSLIGRIKRFFGIASPSTVLADIGRDLIGGLLTGIGDRIAGLRTSVAGWLWDGPDSVLGRIKTGFGIAVKAGVGAAETTATIGRSLVTGLSNGFFEKIDATKNAIVKKFQDLVTAINAALTPMSAVFSNIWIGVQNATIGGVNAVIRIINRFLSGANAVTSKFNITIGTIPEITIAVAKPISVGTQGFGRAPGLASGGQVGGWSPSSTADNIPAWLTAREFVQPVDAVDYYGVSAMEALRRKKIPAAQLAALAAAADAGKVRPADIAGDGSEGIGFLPGYATGGLVGLPRFAGGGFAAPSLIPGVQSFIRAQGGKPYVWASAGPRGYDCSGINDAVWGLLTGRSPYSHYFSTGDFGTRGTHGFVPGTGTYTVGVSHPGESPASNSTGHMAGNLGGLAFESKGSKGVVLGGAARPVSIFRHLFYLPQLGGTYVPAGGGGGGSNFSLDLMARLAKDAAIKALNAIPVPTFPGTQPDWLGQTVTGVAGQLKTKLINEVRGSTALLKSIGGGGTQGLGTATGSANIAALLLAQARSMGASNKVILSLFETALVETGMRNLANPTIPESLRYPHDGLSTDHDSLGIMQQRAGWGSVAERMNVSISARKYLAKAIARQGGYSSAGRLAQAVQVSAFPARYDARRGDAYAWLARLGANFPSGIFDQGGYLPKGLSIAINNTGRAERILNPTETARYDRGQRAGGVNMQIGNYFARDADIHATARELDWMLRGGGL